jgi:hypothetical protein
LRVYLGTYLAALVLVLFPATKVGAGDQYYMPFMPLVLDLSLRVLALGGRAARQRLAVILVVLTAAGASYQPERRFFKKQEWQLSAKVVDEIEQIMKDHPGKRIQMGVGRVPTERGDQLSFHFYVWHNLLVFAGNPYTIETSIMFELTKLGVPFPPAALDRFKTCDTQIWLVPKGGRPFFIQGYYLEPVFPKELVDGFKDNHHLIESRDIFDLWECTPVQ